MTGSGRLLCCCLACRVVFGSDTRVVVVLFGVYVVHDGLGLDSTDANVPCIAYAREWYVMHAVCAICVGCECG